MPTAGARASVASRTFACLIAATLATALALGAAGCAIHATYTEPGSPTIVGQYRRADGTPATGTRVAVTAHRDDSTCARATARAWTDSTGTFRLAPTEIVRHWLVLIPAFEHFENSYWLCAGHDDSLRMAFAGRAWLSERSAALLRQHYAAIDSLACLEWVWEGRTHVTCSGPPKPTILTDGSWTDGRATGFYRLIVGGDGSDARQIGVFLQWVERGDAGSPEIIRQTMALPLAPRPVNLDEARLWAVEGREPCVIVRSTGKPKHWYSWGPPRVTAAFELGPPGQTSAVRSCE